MTPGCALVLVVAIFASLAAPVAPAKKLTKDSEAQLKKIQEMLKNFFIELEDFDDTIDDKMAEKGVTLPPTTTVKQTTLKTTLTALKTTLASLRTTLTTVPTSVAIESTIEGEKSTNGETGTTIAATGSTRVATEATIEAEKLSSGATEAPTAAVTATSEQQSSGEEGSSEEEGTTPRPDANTPTWRPHRTIPPLRTHTGGMYTKPGSPDQKCYCEVIPDGELNSGGDSGGGSGGHGNKTGGGKSSHGGKTGGGKSGHGDKTGGGKSDHGNKTGGGKSDHGGKTGGGKSGDGDKTGGGKSGHGNKTGGGKSDHGGSGSPGKDHGGGSSSTNKTSGHGSHSGGNTGSGGGDNGEEEGYTGEVYCYQNMKNRAVYEGAHDTTINVTASPCNVAWMVVPTSDEIDTYQITGSDCRVDPTLAGLYSVNPNGINIRKATTTEDVQPISTAGLYMSICNDNGIRAGSKLVVVRSGPTCVCANDIDDSSAAIVQLNCSVAFGDNVIHPINPIMTWIVNGQNYGTDMPYPVMTDMYVYTATSSIEIRKSDLNDYSCILTFSEPTNLQYEFIATNAPEFMESCSTPCENPQ